MLNLKEVKKVAILLIMKKQKAAMQNNSTKRLRLKIKKQLLFSQYFC